MGSGWIEESLAEALPYIDVYSVFDDPYRHDPAGILCSKARAIVTQNSFAYDLMARRHPGKSHSCFPPIEVRQETFDSAEEISLPPSFPKKVMGYVGSFGSPRFDLALFEDFVRCLPDWGFLLAGRTDDEGERWVQAMGRYPNFLRLPPVPRRKLAPVWNLLDVTLLLYKDLREQHGAFPSKVLESAFFGVPCVATECVMTRDLEGVFARGHDADRLKNLALEASKMSLVEVRRRYFDSRDSDESRASSCGRRGLDQSFRKGGIVKKRELLVTIADGSFVEAAKQVLSSAYFVGGWRGDMMVLTTGLEEADRKWFKERGILVEVRSPLFSPEEWHARCAWAAAEGEDNPP